MIGNGRECYRLHIIAFFEKEVPCLQGGFFIAYQDRNDWSLAAQYCQAKFSRATRQLANVGLEPANQEIIFPRAKNIANRANSFKVRGGNRPPKYVRIRFHFEHSLHFFRTTNEAAGARK